MSYNRSYLSWDALPARIPMGNVHLWKWKEWGVSPIVVTLPETNSSPLKIGAPRNPGDSYWKPPFLGATPLKTNMEPENGPLEREKHLQITNSWVPSLFSREYVSFRECTSHIKPPCSTAPGTSGTSSVWRRPMADPTFYPEKKQVQRTQIEENENVMMWYLKQENYILHKWYWRYMSINIL